jgi:aminoglycoside phosphotransferase (APT) family kinase protein
MNVVQDSTFPGLAAALDPDRMRAVLSDSALGTSDGLAIEAVRIEQVHYRPNKRCTVLYDVKFRPADGGRSCTQLVAGELTAHGAQPADVPADLIARYRALGQRPLRDPVVHVPALSLAASVFPFDTALPGLVDACNEQHMKTLFERLWHERQLRVRSVEVRCLAYTPGARAALLYEIQAVCRRTSVPEVRRVIGKLYARRDAAEIFAHNWAVWQKSRHRLRMAPPLGFFAAPSVFLQEYATGGRLSELAGTSEFAAPVRGTARAVAALHAMPLPLRFQQASRASVRSVQRWAEVLCAIRTQEHARILVLRDRLVAELEQRAVVTGPIHGDLHPANVLVDGDRLTLIDLDNVILGDRLLDIGRFLASLRTSSLRVHGDLDGLSAVGESFLAQYLRHSGEDERRARLFEAAALLMAAGTGFRLQRDGWAETAFALVERCEAALALSGAGRGVAIPCDQATRLQRDHAANDARGVDLAAWTKDSQYVRGLLSPHLWRLFGAEVATCRVKARDATPPHRHVHLRVEGWRAGASWRGVFDGHRWEDGSSMRHRTERLIAANDAMRATPDGPVLPALVAFLPELGLQVVVTPSGQPLLALLQAEGASQAVCERAGAALAAVHAAPLAIDAARAAAGTRAHLERVQAAVAVLAAAGPGADDVFVMLDRAAPFVSADVERAAPTLKRFSPRRLLLVRDESGGADATVPAGGSSRIAVETVEDVHGVHPLLDAAEFLAQLTLVAPGGDARLASQGFRRGYLHHEPGAAAALAAFEVTALLELAADRRRRADSEGADRLLRAAGERAAFLASEDRP